MNIKTHPKYTKAHTIINVLCFNNLNDIVLCSDQTLHPSIKATDQHTDPVLSIKNVVVTKPQHTYNVHNNS